MRRDEQGGFVHPAFKVAHHLLMKLCRQFRRSSPRSSCSSVFHVANFSIISPRWRISKQLFTKLVPTIGDRPSRHQRATQSSIPCGSWNAPQGSVPLRLLQSCGAGEAEARTRSRTLGRKLHSDGGGTLPSASDTQGLRSGWYGRIH